MTELLSEHQLSDLLPPSLRYLLALATHRHPRYLLRILNSFDEVYALLALGVEHHYLSTYSGTFTENFYNLKRERVLRVKGGEVPRAQLGASAQIRESLKLRRADVWKNLAVIVGLPYLKRKLDEGRDIHAPAADAVFLGPQYGRDQLPANASIKERILFYYKWFLRKVYPHINAAYYFAMLIFQLSYLFDASKFHSPFLWLIGTRMRRLGEADFRAFATAAEGPAQAAAGKPARPGQSNSLFNPRTFAATVGPRLLGSLKILLPTSIFALKFLEWWHASDFARQLSKKAAEGLELPPPVTAGPRPPSIHKDEEGAMSSTDEKSTSDGKNKALAGNALLPKPAISATTHLPIYTVPRHDASSDTSDLCPICQTPIQTATASPYGYVYCYVCIHKWVEGEHDRQTRFMEGQPQPEGIEDIVWQEEQQKEGSREGRWESGKGRCAVSGKRILGGTEGLRRVVV